MMATQEQKELNAKKSKLDQEIRKRRRFLHRARKESHNFLEKYHAKHKNEHYSIPNGPNNTKNKQKIIEAEESKEEKINAINNLKINLKPSKIMKGHGNKIYALAWNPEKPNEVVSASRDSRLIFWNIDSGYKRLAYNLETEFVMTVAYSPNCKYVACGGLDDETSIFEIKQEALGVADVTPVQVLRGHTGYISCIEYIDNNRILTSSGDRTIRLWDVIKEKETNCYNIHNGDVMSIELNKFNKNIFVSGSIDSTCKISDLRQDLNKIKGTQIFNIEQLTDVNCVKWFRDGKSVVAGCDDGIVRFFDQSSKKCLQEYNIEKYYNIDEYKKNLEKYLGNEKDDDIDDIEQHETKTPIDTKIDDKINLNNNEEELVPSQTSNEEKKDDSQSNYDGFENEKDENEYFVNYDNDNRGNDGVAKLDFSLSGAFMFVSYNNGKKNEVIVWNTVTTDIADHLEHDHHVPCLAVSPDGKKLVTGCWDHHLRLWIP